MNQKLSVVIIGRNEERGIARCVDAARAAALEIGGAEMIFVDSASTDRTVEIVESMGVEVVRLDASLKLSPSAGRYAGSLRATGDLILFIDADTLVYQGFLSEALPRFERAPRVAGINGRIDDLDENGDVVPGAEDRFDEVASVKWLRGPCCLFRREALMSVGSFNPHLAVEEEAELGLRLRSAGWELELIPVPMGCHTRFFHHQSLQSVVGAFRRDVVVGRLGEMTRTAAYAFRAGNGLEFCWMRLNTTILFAAWMFFGLICLALPATLHPAALFGAVSIFGFALVLAKKKSLRHALVFIPAKFLCFVDVVAGINKLRLHDPADYFQKRGPA